MLNLYNFIEQSRMFRQFKVDELLFTAYDCIIEESPLDYWTEKNYFTYTVRGKLKWKTLDSEVLIEPGSTVFVRKGAHRAFKVDDGDFCALLIFIPDEFIRSVLYKHELALRQPEATSSPETIIQLETTTLLSTYFESVLNYFSQSQPPPESLLKVRFEELILTIAHSAAHKGLADYFASLCRDDKRSIAVLMEDTFRFQLTIDELAKMIGRSPSTFKRDFVQTFGTTPGGWIRERRLAHAKFLLETTDLTISEVAYESGFSNPSHFTRVFKGRYSKTPQTYRSARTT